MPMMGPDKGFAYSKGEEAFQEVMALLYTKYGVRPESNKITPFGNMAEEYTKAEEQLKLAIQEVIWNDHCCAF